MRRGSCVVLLCGLTLSTPLHAQAQAGKDAAAGPAGVPAVAKAPPPLVVPSLDSVLVTGVRRLAHDGGERTHGDTTAAGLGDIILVKVSHLKELVNYSNCLSNEGLEVPKTLCRQTDIALYLDGREIKGIKPESGAPIPDQEELRYHLTRSPDSDEAWADLLGNPPFGSHDRFFRRPTELSVGLSGEYALATDVGSKNSKFELIRFREVWFWGSTAFGAVFVVWIVMFARTTPLLRDAGRIISGAKKQPLPPYSLGRVQMAFWFVLVVLSFVYIWLITNGWDTINTTVLGLIGIGTGTALGAQLIDGTPDDQPPVVRESKHFIPDVLQDGDGYAFHRVQMFIWTIVLGILFLYSVWQRLSMPEFSATLLGLLGISGGTYIGFKIPETPHGTPPRALTAELPLPPPAPQAPAAPPAEEPPPAAAPGAQEP
ncbi:MAG: hypothetical protein ABI625_14485 [bacterium]